MPPSPPIAPLDFSGVIPAEFSTQIIQEAIQQSAALSLGRRVPMGTTVNTMPVPKAFPRAAFVSVGGRKPYTDMKLDLESITAEEIAAVVAIPDAMIEDSSINLWEWARPLLGQAIGQALDAAVFFGTGAPATYPAGGIEAIALNPGAGVDAVDTINLAMSAVEAQGLSITGHAADLGVKGALRGVRDQSGALLLGTQQADQTVRETIYGLPVAYESFPQVPPDFITGNWDFLLIGVRQDIRYNIDPNAVIVDEDGRVVIAGWQDNVTGLKVWARFGCVILKPVTVRQPDGAIPFAMANVAPTAPGGGGGGGDAEGLAARQARARQTAGSGSKG